MSDDTHWRDASQMLAADNARLCGRLLTAEAVVDAIRDKLNQMPLLLRTTLRGLIEAHDAGKAN